MNDVVTRNVEIARKDSAVILVINCEDDYESMLLYDEIIAEMADGYLAIEFETDVKRGGSDD